MDKTKRPKPQEHSRQEELEDKIADLVAEAVYEKLVREKAKPKEGSENDPSGN